MEIHHSPQYLAESRQADILSAAIVTYTAALAAVTLRFWSRKIRGVRYWLDDWMIVTAQISATAFIAHIGWSISIGLGKHREASGPKIDYNFFLSFFIGEIIYGVIIAFVKFSILALYWRVFGKEAIRWPVYIMLFITTAWFIACLFASLFTCSPPKAMWDKSVKNARCDVDHKKVMWGCSIPNIITDVILLLLPIPYVMRLSAPPAQKRLILGTFSLGGFVCVASIMRFVSVIREDQGPDASWHWVNQGLWAITECHFAIISACLPTLRPIWVRIFGSSPSPSELGLSRTPHVTTIGGSGASSGKQKRKEVDESLLASSMDDSEHPFRKISDSGESGDQIVYAPKGGVYTARATFEGYELEEASSVQR